MIAEIILNMTAKELNRTFDYKIPSKLEGIICLGSRVFVPFGNSKRLEEGFVVGLKEKQEENVRYKLKEIETVEDNLLTKKNIELANLMARRYFCNVFDCIKLMLPPGMATKNFSNRIKAKLVNQVYLNKEWEEIELEIEENKMKSEKQIRVLHLLNENEGVTIPDLEILCDVTAGVIKTLEKNGYVKIVEEEIERNPFLNKEVEKTIPLKLTKEQQDGFNRIKAYMEKKKYQEFLIHGITGSRQN